MGWLFGQSRQQTLQEALADPFPPPKRWSMRVWWDESAFSLFVTVAVALVLLLLAFLWQRITPPPPKLGEENLLMMPVTLGLGTDVGSPAGGSGGGSSTDVPVVGEGSVASDEPPRDLGSVKQQDVRANAALKKVDPGEAYQASPERLARMRAILDQLEKAGERIHELGKGELSGIFKINDDCKSVVFVVDRSGSMSWNNSLERVKSEMSYGIAQLKPDQSFAVVFFDDGVYTMNPQFALAKATPANIKAVEAWMQTIFPAGGTTPYPAMELALSVNPELIILLSDGEFDPRNVQQITQRNQAKRDKKCRIDCIGLGSIIVTLNDIAQQNGGKYKMAR